MEDFERLYETFGSRIADLPGYGTTWGSFSQLYETLHGERVTNAFLGLGFLTNEEYTEQAYAQYGNSNNSSGQSQNFDIGYLIYEDGTYETWFKIEVGSRPWISAHQYQAEQDKRFLEKFPKGPGVEMLDPLDHMGLIGIFSAIKSGIVTAVRQRTTYEISDGVRRAMAADILGKKTITAVDNSGKMFQVPIRNLRSPNKSVIDLRKPGESENFRSIYYEIKFGNINNLPPIYVNPGSRGIKLPEVKFKF